MASEMTHLRVLADDIGPRPATSDTEAHAADYIEAVFASRGLDVERQEFVTPRTYSWAYVIYYVLTIASAYASGYRSLIWPAFILAALTAIVMWSDLDTRWGLSALMPKGPSQNIVARHTPKMRRGERMRTVVVVAHYDSAKASLAFAPSMVKNFNLTFSLMKACTILVPVLILAGAVLPAYATWIWYATLVVAAYLLIPLVINVHRELFAKATNGANDNASGVAAMLGVMETVVPEPGEGFMPPPVVRRRGLAAAEEAGVLPEDTLLTYSPADAPEEVGAPLPDDFMWADASNKPQRGQSTLEFDTIEFESIDEPATGPGRGAESPDVFGDSESADSSSNEDIPAKPKKKPRRFSGGKDSALTGWLGVGDDFSARKEGRKIGSWDNFGDEVDDDDDTGFKGGWAGDDPIGDPEFAATEAARIRRRVTESVDRELQDKEVWFVATGAEEVGTRGMHAFLREYGKELKDAAFINIDNIGAGALYWVTSEGMARHYKSDRRLVSLARRVSREHDMLVRPRAYRGLSTDATPALARKYRAMSIMSFDINGQLPNWHWYTDTTENVSPELVELASSFVSAMVRDL